MRKVIASAFVSLDGVMQAPGGPEEDPTGGFRYGGWTFHYWDDVMGRKMDQMFADPFDLLLGRRTYEIFAAYWPYVSGEDSIATVFNAATKYVATSSNPALTWQRSVALRSNVPAEVARLKQQDGPNLLIQGSSVLVHSLLANDLIDELTLLTFPLVLGRGKRFFDESSRPGALEVAETSVSGTGVTISSYRRGGPITTGSFAQEKPSDAELARREKLERE